MSGQVTLSRVQYESLLNQARSARWAQIAAQPEGLRGPVLSTEAAVTLYVTAAGDDSNDGLTSDTALATIRAALDKVPKQVRHAIQVLIGAGTFAAFDITGFMVELGGSLTVEGTLANPTLTTGTTSGTATGGSNIQLIDGGQTWTTNELRGRLVRIGADYRVVRDNTGTTINFGSKWGATCNGKSYEILEQATIISGTSVMGYGPVGISCNVIARRDLYLRNLKVASGTAGIMAFNTDLGTMERIHASGPAGYGMILQSVGGEPKLFEVYTEGCTYNGIHGLNIMTFKDSRLGAYDNGGSGVYIEAVHVFANWNGFFDENTNHGLEIYLVGAEADVDNTVYARGNGKSGIAVSGCPFLDIDDAVLENNGDYGIEIDSNAVGNRYMGSFVNLVGNVTIQNNTDGGIICRNRSGLALANVDGSGNGNYGVELQTGSWATVTSATGITGASGDASVDGSNALSWASDFGSNGDIVSHLTNGCRIERRD